MESPCSVNTENDYADLHRESLYDPAHDWPKLLVPPVAVYCNSPPPSTTTCVPESDTLSLVLQLEVPTPVSQPLQLHPHQGFSVCRAPAPSRPRGSPSGANNPEGKGKDKEKLSPDLRTTFTTYTDRANHAVLDLLATVATARDDELRLPIAASDYLDIVRALDVFHQGDNIDGCSPEQVEYFGMLSEIYRASDVIRCCISKIHNRSLIRTMPLSEVIMISMLEKGYLEVLEAITGGAYHYLANHQVREFLSLPASRLLDRIKPKEEPLVVKTKQKEEKHKEVEWCLLELGWIDQGTLFKEVGA
ncbi:hypothetical protein M404DRAFT_25338 [Pisolithus tinctorius Marx 270]|uniref:Uncharacterized protein n=1 Tax=Pisolithus tinctorius Marx 270 TaxID=870435 RepID=A0A0C3J9A8_PISTI|nr:hypothetical protein M404DRAFT_25338 [Pisolithus tinctorius Marx 270]